MPLFDTGTDEEYTSSMKMARLFELIGLLQRQEIGASDIVEILGQYYQRGESGERLVRRDIRTLRDIGFSIDTRSAPSRYVLDQNPLAIPLNNEQIDTLAALRDGFGKGNPLAGPIQSLLKLLSGNLNDEQREHYMRPSPLRLSLHTAVNYDAARPLLPLLQRAIQRERQVRFDYQSLVSSEHPLQHIVDPYEIEYLQQHIYLVGKSNLGTQVINYRLDRILPDSLVTLPTQAAKKSPFLYLFRYRLNASLARRGISERFSDQRIVQLYPDGSVEVEARERSQFYAIRGLLRYADNAIATSPAELVQAMEATLEAMQANYRNKSI